MVASLRASAANTAGAGSDSAASLTLPVGIADGDVGLLWFGINSSATTVLSAPAGWTPVEGPVIVGTTLSGWLYRKALTEADAGAEVTWAFTGNGRWHAGAAVVQDADPTLDSVLSWTDNSQDTALSIPAYTPGADDTLVVTMTCLRYSLTTTGVTWPGGYSEQLDVATTNGTAPRFGVSMATKPLTGQGGTEQAAQNGTIASASRTCGFVATFAPASAGGEHKTTTATISLSLATTAGATKAAATGADLALGLTTASDDSKAAATSADVPLSITASADSTKAADTTAAIPLALDTDASSSKTATTAADLPLSLDVTGTVTPTELEHHDTTTALTLTLTTAATVVQRGPGRDLTISIGAPTAHPLAVTGPHGRALSIGAPTRHPLTISPPRCHPLHVGAPAGHPATIGPPRS